MYVIDPMQNIDKNIDDIINSNFPDFVSLFLFGRCIYFPFDVEEILLVRMEDR